MKPLAIIYLIYMFISLYFFFFFIFIYLRNRKILFKWPRGKVKRSLSVIIPAYNEEDVIEDTVKAVLNSSYKIDKLIVVNDGSTDKTKEIVERLAKKNKKIMFFNRKNTGKAASLNYGLKYVRSELVAVIDADSYPKKDAIEKMIGFFDDEKVACATSSILVKNRKQFIEILQSFEYAVIAWTRKLLEYIGGIWATPGPLSIYRKSALDKIKGFDEKNLTEDIEVTWHLIHEGYKIKMCLPAFVYTHAPIDKKGWMRQRIRWDIGGMQTVKKYSRDIFKRGMVGNFILPFFVISMFLGLLGVSVFAVLALRRFFKALIFTRYSFVASTPLLTVEDVYLTPTILNFIGILLILLGVLYTITALISLKQGKIAKEKVFNLIFYTLFYLTMYPLILVIAIYKIIIRDIKW